MREFNALFPPPGNQYGGSSASLWFLVALTVMTTARSLVHIVLPDGGATVIAGLDTSVDGGANLIALFAQWGLVQLLLSLVAWVVLWRYRHLVPFVLLLLLFEWLGRLGIGLFKPVIADGTPPGVVGNFVIPPLAAVALWFSLPRRQTRTTEQDFANP